MTVEQFLRPSSPAEAVALRARSGAVFLAGGTELNRGGTPRASTLISLAALPLRFVRAEGGAVLLGPMLTLQEIAAGLPSPGLGILCEAARAVGNRSIRNLATLGGNIAANKSCADLIPSLLVLGASLVLLGPEGEREVALDGHLSAPDRAALILAVRVPRPRPGVRLGRQRFSRTANDLALVNVALLVRLDGTRLAEARLALGGVAPRVVRLPGAEAVLTGADLSAGCDALLGRLDEAVRCSVHPISDLRGSADFKRELAAVLACRALGACLNEEAR
ncbi:MAG: FAD binding domain-containing protein [Deltaproteobacteria bacterium]|nr:FAD binding domain-containing protein [Deltaproteobacteria bacterium]